MYRWCFAMWYSHCAIFYYLMQAVKWRSLRSPWFFIQITRKVSNKGFKIWISFKACNTKIDCGVHLKYCCFSQPSADHAVSKFKLHTSSVILILLCTVSVSHRTILTRWDSMRKQISEGKKSECNIRNKKLTCSWLKKEDYKPSHTDCAEALELAGQCSCGTFISGLDNLI